MAGKARYTDAQKKQMVKLREDGLSMKAIGEQIQKKYKLPNTPAQPTVSRILKEQEAKTNASLSAGELALKEATQAKQSGQVIAEAKAPVQTVPPTVDTSNVKIDASKISSEALSNFMNGTSDAEMDNLASQMGGDFGDTESLFDDLTNDSTVTTESSYTNYDMAETVSDDINTSMDAVAQMRVATLKASPEFMLSNDHKYFIETLLKGQIRPIGFVVEGNLYFPSYNFGYLFQVQNATRLPNGLVAVIGGVIRPVEASFFDDKLDQGITKSVLNFKNYIETEYTAYSNVAISEKTFGQGTVLTYSELFTKYNTPNATAFISVANTLQQNKQLKSIQALPMLQDGSRVLDLVVTMTTFGVNVLSFNK